MTINEPRIAIFDEWLPVHHSDPECNFADDVGHDTDRFWKSFVADPQVSISWTNPDGQREFVVRDRNAKLEIKRLLLHKSCPICRKPMDEHADDYDGVLFLCSNCGYWAGNGHRDHDSHQHSERMRAVFGKYTPVHPLSVASTEYLVTHLRRFPNAMRSISPQRAEKFVVDLLVDYLGCEVRSLGGVKDGGVDGYILRGDEVSTIIQVKWRQDQNKAEAVSVVRELAGTMLVQGAPEGFLVSNRKSFSKQARSEAAQISTRSVKDMGELKVSLLGYHDILDMLEISNSHISSGLTYETLEKWHDSYCVFDGAARLSEEHFPGMVPISF